MPVIKNGVPTWPEVFPQEVIDQIRSELGSIEFARQYLLDVKAVEGQTLKRDWLHYWPVEKIDKSWPVVFGIDYASSVDKMKDRDRDYASIAIGRKVPGGGLVVVDGFRSNVMGQGELEQKLLVLATIYNPVIIGVEKLGKGEEFYAALTRHAHLPAVPTTVGQKSKGDRFEKIMAPHFEFNRVWVSDNQTPWLKAFENEWVSWPNGENDDCLDSVFHMMEVSKDALPNAMNDMVEYREKKKIINPWASWAA
jgi:phage terminase large subunit-like protein